MTNLSFATPLSGNNVRVVYIDGLTTYYGPGIAGSLAVPGVANATLYNFVNLGHIHNYGGSGCSIKYF